MARRSTIDRLPPDILAKLQELLRDPRMAQLDATVRINAILEERGEKPISKSALNRYSMRMEEVGSKLRQSREVAAMWIGKLGAEPQGEVGKLLNEIVRNLAFDTAMQLSEGEEPVPPKLIKELSIAVERLEKAADLNVKREQEIKDQARKESADIAETVAKQGGLSNDSVQELRRAILGVRA